MLEKDTELFAASMGAYGRCDLDKLATFFSDDAEFFHDRDGLMNRTALIETIRKNGICGKLRRELVPGSLEVHPLPGYGALAAGAHRFYRMENGKEVGGTVAAKFMHVWRNENGTWKLTRVISYAH